MAVLLICAALLLAWLPIDFRLGRKRRLAKASHSVLPVRKGDFQLYTFGPSLYDTLFTDIQRATDHIHILFFIIKNDAISHRFLQLLMEKAEEGVEVRLLVDRIGGFRLTNEWVRQLKQSGVQFSFCHPIRLPFLFYSANERNHRKIAIIDGTIGYIGGFNIGEEYLGHNPKLGNWRDYHLRLTGEGVQDLQQQFLRDWRDETKQHLLYTKTYFPPLEEGPVRHRFIPTDGAYLKKTFLDLIDEAKESIFIGSPYFVPGREIMKALLDAAARGIHITILVPERADHILVREAKFPYLRRLIQAGCRTYLFQDGFFHAKIILIDDRICDIGTANFDLRSLYINHEINCLLYEPSFIRKVKREIDRDIQASRLVTIEELSRLTLSQKCKEWIARAVSFFL